MFNILQNLRENIFSVDSRKIKMVAKKGTVTITDHGKNEDLDHFLVNSAIALSRITGINYRQLWHYASGMCKPRPAQRKRIEDGLHRLGHELLSIGV